MKLAVRRTCLGDRLCFPEIVEDRLVDVQAAYAHQLARSGLYRDDAIERARREIGPDLPALLRADADLALVRKAHEHAVTAADLGDLPSDCTWTADQAELGAPIGRPRTVWGMTANYPRTHSGPDPRTADGIPNPAGFLKSLGSLAGPHDDIRYPAISRRVDPELELGVVIGRRARQLTEDNAMDAVAGYVAFVDIGARDIGEQDNRRLDRAKGFDTFSVIGPWFVTADEIPDPHHLRIRFWVNDELRQDGSTAQMFHPIPEQLAWLTSALTLAPGDVLSTGTPPGVRPVRPGDELRGEIDGLGVVANTVVAADLPIGGRP
ncbi:MAG TPA: fumarylacetoacetate hydrolase family protein [Pseudonocardiaceae bacterium]|jgi:5-oxopent-3-ene-1,2,5-tricarboxylate decarboxylase/2-hydroxyhepta-2,4-diene-1,7-dioate isomerase|nr:fumarylacetoacetate hydrolase family protein [Pseudonocardiaceae bacterium]